jgi:prolyl oligopeptidase
MKKLTLLLCFLLVLPSSIFLTSAQETTSDDPYIWLEEVESEKSLDWVRAQNAISDKQITNNPIYEPLRKRYLEVFNDKDQIIYPNLVGDYVYNLWQDEVNERGLWRRMPKKDYLDNKTTWETVLDLDVLSKKEDKKWVFAGSTWLEPNNKICLISLSDGGKDENVIREFNAEAKEFVKNGFYFPESKGGVSWVDENSVMVYRDFGPGTLTTSGYPRQVKIVKRGDLVEDVEPIFETDTTSVGAFGGSNYSNNKNNLYVYNAIAFYNSEFLYLDNGKFKKVAYPKDAEISVFHKDELIISLQSDWKINKNVYKSGSLVSFNLKDFLSGDINIKTIYVPNERSSFVSISTSKDFVVVNTMENVQNKLIKYAFSNQKWLAENIEAPEFGSISLIASSDQSNDYFFRFSNFINPTTLYHSDGKKIEVVKKLKDVFNKDDLVVTQFMATSKDGTKIPYFVVHHKDIKLNGLNPTMIYAYGGFNVSSQPNYSSTYGIGWLEKGGVYVLANIRGGGEFGPEWHKAAMKEKRQNGYDDFYAVSEDLIAKKVTSPDYLGAFGWSNGGLMAGVVFTQRPDLYNAVVVGAPLLDMKRYSKLLAGASWMGEFGNPDIPEEWEYIKKYSPYHNVFKDKKYPEVFFVTSTKDDRVHPGHARKMAAKMETMGHSYFYHETIEGGHGAASTNEQQAAMWASIYTYFNMKLNNKTVLKQ